MLLLLVVSVCALAFAAACERRLYISPVYAGSGTGSAVSKKSERGGQIMYCSSGDGGLTPPASESETGSEVSQDMFKRAIISEGDAGRLVRVMRKAERGEDITVAVLGGSITAGSCASDGSLCYASLVRDWWERSFPRSRVIFHNMGIGATGSLIGVHRMKKDILDKKPDFVIVEFAVNDDENAAESYECILRRLLAEEQHIAVIMLFMTTQEGRNRQSDEIPLGSACGIPMISYHDAIQPLLAAGTLAWKDISPDNIHPNDKGHAIVASLICSYLDKVRAELPQLSDAVAPLPGFVAGSKYMDAELYTIDTFKPDSLGDWTVDTDLYFFHLHGLWKSTAAGAPLVFTVSAACVNLLYYKDMKVGAGDISVVIDGGAPETFHWQMNESWGNYMTSMTIFDSDKTEKHTISIANAGGSFFLAGIMLA